MSVIYGLAAVWYCSRPSCPGCAEQADSRGKAWQWEQGTSCKQPGHFSIALAGLLGSGAWPGVSRPAPGTQRGPDWALPRHKWSLGTGFAWYCQGSVQNQSWVGSEGPQVGGRHKAWHLHMGTEGRALPARIILGGLQTVGQGATGQAQAMPQSTAGEGKQGHPVTGKKQRAAGG